MSRYLGIHREPVYSPGRVDDDGAILDQVSLHLRARGHEVTVCSGDPDTWPVPAPGAIVFTMCQGARALAQFASWQARGVRIVNSPAAILNCQRHRTVAALAGTTIPFPDTVLLDLHGPHPLPAWIALQGAWIKRGDVHATEVGDVVHVDGVAAAEEVLRRLRARGIRQAAIQRHVPGVVVKFYAVRGRFFHCVPPDGPLSRASIAQVAAVGAAAAQRLQVEIYGGDAVVGLDDKTVLIDLNDWPSYASCRAEAAAEIAAYLHAQEVASET